MDKSGAGGVAHAAWAARMNSVIEYIDKNLAGELDLESLATVAAYSRYHFHRLFRAAMGETLADYIMRQRLEKAAYRLCVEPGRSVTEIALECGFSNSAVFAKNFRAHFGRTASEWRNSKQGCVADSEAKVAVRRQLGDDDVQISVVYKEGAQAWIINQPQGERCVAVDTMPDRTLAYLRYIGPYKGDESLFLRLFTQLFTWLGPRGLVSPQDTKAMVLYHEYPEITAEELLRISVCCTVPPGTTGEGEIGVMPFSPGLCATSWFECAAHEYQSAWDWMYATWLPESGFLPADIPPFEYYDFDAFDQTSGKTRVAICIPVMPG